MDLSKLDLSKSANEGSVLKLVFPADIEEGEGEDAVLIHEKGDPITDEKGKSPKQFFVRLLGTDSDTYRKLSNRSLEKTFNSRDKKKKVDIAVTQREVAEKFAKCTTECYFIENGKEVECTPSEMTRVYLQYTWIKEQVDEFINERSNFTKG
tara:strand:- start:414 stop:869 length:456 start_codon:yes stop_codon:yes gene_type:complete